MSTHDPVRLETSTDLGLPRPGIDLDPEHTAIVVTDPQNDFLSPDGVTWGVVGDGYQAALANFHYVASAVVTADEAVETLGLAFEAR